MPLDPSECSSRPLLGNVFEIQKLSTEDGPGIRTTVFLKECPLKCVWCHNPESIEKQNSLQWFQAKCIGCNTCIELCPEQALRWDSAGLIIDRAKCTVCGECARKCPATALKEFGKIWTIEDLFGEIAKDESYYHTSNGGVTFSGGEPTMQFGFLEQLLKKCKQAGYHTAVDTCGLVSRAKLESLIPFVDLVLYDLKEIDAEKHIAYTGVANSLILENCKWLASELAAHNKDLWIRTPIIPGYTATVENVRGIRDFISDELDGQIQRWDLLAFNNLAGSKYRRMGVTWPLENAPLFTASEMEAFYEIALARDLPNVKWSGLTR